MNAEILDSTSSPPTGEVNYKKAALSSSPPARRWRIRLAFSLGVLVLAASFVIVAISLNSHAGPTSAPVTSASIPADSERWSSGGEVDVEGGKTSLYPLQFGRVMNIEVREGEFVKAGTPLFRLDDTVQRLKVRQAKSDLEGARHQLTIAEAGVEEADKQIEAQKKAIAIAKLKVELARVVYNMRKRYEKEKIEGNAETVQAAKLTVEQAELGVKAEEEKLAVIKAAKHRAEGSVAAAKDLITAKEAQLEETNKVVEECIVRAPVDGTLLRINVTVGETLGANPRRAAIEFAAARPLLVRAEVGQEFAGKVRANQDVIIEDNVTGQECARGKVASLALWYAPRRTANGEIMPMNSDNRTLECIIRIETTSQILRIGQRVRVQFTN